MPMPRHGRAIIIMSFIIKPPLPPMEARSVDEIPIGDEWQYEPKWDGFRCIAFRDRTEIYLQSKAGQPLAHYFPDIAEGLEKLRSRNFVLDGELAVPVGGALSFDGCLRSFHGWQISTRHKNSSLALGQSAASMHPGSGRESRG